MYKGTGAQSSKQVALALYLFELVFKLCIVNADNISQSPGFAESNRTLCTEGGRGGAKVYFVSTCPQQTG